MFTTLIIIALFTILVVIFLQHPRFGGEAKGVYRERLNSSPNLKNGRFENRSPTPALTEGYSYGGVMRQFLFGKKTQKTPLGPLPFVKRNLTEDTAEDSINWFGHSSYLLQLDGKKILVDPVFSGSASPFRRMVRNFEGSNPYSVADMPPIDYLLITHDHWDHLDYRTVKELEPKVGKLITGLGVGAHLRRWGYSDEKIIELDWDETHTTTEGYGFTAVTARHFSGRSMKRNNTLWISLVLDFPSARVFVGGDSGYDEHFRQIGKEYGPFQLAILENGQYDPAWKYIHMMPEEVVTAGKELGARTLMPVHWGKFSLSNHAWNEPIERVNKAAVENEVQIIHPRIGERVLLNEIRKGEEWWKRI